MKVINENEALKFPCSICVKPLSNAISYLIDQNELLLKFSDNALTIKKADRFPIASFDFKAQKNSLISGDGFQMLAQTAGTFSAPIDIGRCPDNNESYRIYGKNEPKRYYNYLVIQEKKEFTLFGFTSCNKFSGYFEMQNEIITAFIDGESDSILEITHKKRAQLEKITVLQSANLNELYKKFADLINQSHKPRRGANRKAPVGWCSWYAYYAGVGSSEINLNLNKMIEPLDELQWVLLDDGYQEFMGDWLSNSKRFEGGVRKVIEQIKAKGKKPGIWLAPFIAESNSKVFKEHPDWFVKNDLGEQLKAQDITYGGWRCTPWYILDTTNSEVCNHLTDVVKTMRESWGVKLFKLDANYWGAIKGVRQKSNVTGVEAYRMGMEAVAKGAGDALLLGCNAPIWPSLGLVDAMRISDDVMRDEQRFSQIAKEIFYRSWQHKNLWQIDPDCATFISIEGEGSTHKGYLFHRNVLLASGGLLLSGDPLDKLNKFAKESLTALFARQKITQEQGVFIDLNIDHAILDHGAGTRLHILFNYFNSSPKEFVLESDKESYWFDYYTDEALVTFPQKEYIVQLEQGPSSIAILSKSQKGNCW